jgi:hypothetical protein
MLLIEAVGKATSQGWQVRSTQEDGRLEEESAVCGPELRFCQMLGSAK